jgi:hypothetical protein
MNEETQVTQTEPAVETTTQTETEKTVDDTAVQSEKSKELESALAQKDHFRKKAEKAEAERRALEEKLNKVQGFKPTLDVEDYIKISSSLNGMDNRQQTYLAEQHKLTGKPIEDIKNSEDFAMWNSGYLAKAEKEKALKPSATQSDSDKPKSLTEKLASASMADKEKILTEAGLYKQFRPRADRTNIGNPGLR